MDPVFAITLSIPVSERGNHSGPFLYPDKTQSAGATGSLSRLGRNHPNQGSGGSRQSQAFLGHVISIVVKITPNDYAGSLNQVHANQIGPR